MICDVHIHLCPYGGIDNLPKLAIPAYQQVRDNSAEDYIALANKKGVSKAVIFPHVYPELAAEHTTQYILAVARKYPSRFIPFLRIDETVENIDRLSSQIMGIKEHFLVTGKDTKKYMQHYDLMQSKQLFLISHPSTSVRIERMREIASNFPHLPIILAHCGRAFNAPRDIIFTEVGEQLKKFDNIFFDTSTVRDSVAIASLINKVGSTRIFFGSDIPFGTEEISKDYSAEINTIMKCKISSEDKQNILFKNFRAVIDTPWIEKQKTKMILLTKLNEKTK